MVNFLNKKSIFFLLLSLIVVLFYQQCSNVNLSYEEQRSLGITKIRGKFCFSQSASQYSKYKVSGFYVVNMTSRPDLGELNSDSDINSVIDKYENNISGLEKISTVTVSDLDNDKDGVPDFLENLKGLNSNFDEMHEDGYDRDGVLNIQEIERGQDPNYYDKDQSNIEASVEIDFSASTEDQNCGVGQPIYQFNVSKINRVPTSVFSDNVNSSSEKFNLSHSENENIILILFRLRSENLNYSDYFYGKIIKIKLGELPSLELKPTDFSLLPKNIPF